MFDDDTSMLGYDKNVWSLQSQIKENTQIVSQWFMMAASNWNILLALCEGNPPVTFVAYWIPLTKASDVVV